MTRIGEGRKASFLLFDSRLWIAFLGVFLSIALHELFHILMHWNSIVSVKILPNIYTLVEVNSTSLHHYDTSLEELIAYSITLVTLLATAMLIVQINDSKDTRSFSEILLPKNSDIKNLSETEFFELVHKSELFKNRV